MFILNLDLNFPHRISEISQKKSSNHRSGKGEIDGSIWNFIGGGKIRFEEKKGKQELQQLVDRGSNT